MFMNAQPRALSHGFQPFVPRNRVESYQKFFDMPNEVNVWGVHGAVAPAVTGTDNWDYDFGQNNEDGNFSFSPDIYAGCLGTDSFNSLAQVNSQVKSPVQSAMIWRGQSMSVKQTAQTQYDFQQLPSTSFDTQRAVMDVNKHVCLAQDTTGMSYSTRAHLSSNGFSCRAPRNPENGSLMGLSSFSQRMSSFGVIDSSARSDSLDSDYTSPSTVESTSFAAGKTTSDPMAMSFNSLAVNDDMNDGKWWDDLLKGAGMASSTTTMMPFSYDGLPGPRYNFHPTSASSPSSWSQEAAPSGTVSPQALTLSRPSISMMSSEVGCSFKTPMSGAGRVRSTAIPVTPSQISAFEARKPPSQFELSRPRQKLPSKPVTRPHVSILPSNDRGIQKPEHSRSDGTKSTTRKSSTMPSRRAESSSLAKKSAISPRTLVPKIDPTPTDGGRSANIKAVRTSSTSLPDKSKPIQRREELDGFLVKSKMAGMSYKDIRRRGGFSEAESTLRGRFRTLTKKKDERVRKPEWEDNDIRLLKKAVRKLSHGSDPSKQKTPWKQVAEYIFDNGGSYHFGNATCRKRWDQIHGK